MSPSSTAVRNVGLPYQAWAARMECHPIWWYLVSSQLIHNKLYCSPVTHFLHGQKLNWGAVHGSFGPGPTFPSSAPKRRDPESCWGM